MASTKPPAPESPATECPNPRTAGLDRLSIEEIVGLLLDEDAGVSEAVRRARPSIEAGTALLVEVLGNGGRWINLGAGTSGRIGVVDAAEIPPTFGLEPSRVQAILAGGRAALERAVEGAEDNPDAGAFALRELELGSTDAVVALSASGQTPFVLGAVAYAREVGARTLAISCNPDAPLARSVDIAILAQVGPEAIAGSTRLKGGLAQKMILHTLSTATMVRLGRVRGNLMTGIRPTTAKLRARAVAIVAQLAGVETERAEQALEAAGDSVESALSALGADDTDDPHAHGRS
ncbi:MAG: N-acetylmuramic acid 6-phosphate etherase [Myxococcota bacterium]|nr:N-acetylmuramic acid 6-phosphate etherase [Myxococcota bacterium]